jgi:DNA polymerase III subunit epsilon
MLLFGLDFETGGSFEKPLEENFITEVGAVLWDTEAGCPVRMMNRLVYQGKPIAEEATQYTGITNEMIAKHGEPLSTVIGDLCVMAKEAEYIVAQNGLMFDRPLLKIELDNCGMGDMNPRQLWLDTTCDVPYPKNCRNTNLTYLAGFHLILNCFPHRAVTDVLTMMAVLQKYDINTVIRNASQPTLLVRALVTYDQRDLAKKAGFYWEPKDKFWLKNVRKGDFGDFKAGCNFNISVIKEELREGAPLPEPELPLDETY